MGEGGAARVKGALFDPALLDTQCDEPLFKGILQMGFEDARPSANVTDDFDTFDLDSQSINERQSAALSRMLTTQKTGWGVGRLADTASYGSRSGSPLMRAPPASRGPGGPSTPLMRGKRPQARTPSNPSSPFPPARMADSDFETDLQRASESINAGSFIACEHALGLIKQTIDRSMSEGIAASSHATSFPTSPKPSVGLSDGQVERSVRMMLALLERGTRRVLPLHGLLEPTLSLLAASSVWDPFRRAMAVGEGVVSCLLPVLKRPESSQAAQLDAMHVLANLTAEADFKDRFKDAPNATAAALGAVLVLVGSDAASCSVRELGAKVLKNVAVDDEMRAVLVGRGAVDALVRVCACAGSWRLQEQAARALGNVAVEDANEASIVDSGGVEALTPLVSSPELELMDAALGALANLVSNPQMRARFVACRGIELLDGAVRSPEEHIFKQAGWIIACLSVDPATSGAVVERGGLPLLVHYASKPDDGYREEGAWALANLSSAAAHAIPMREVGALALLLELASSTSSSVKMQAVWALANLAVNPELKLCLGEMGAVRELLRTLPDEEEEQCLVQTTRAVANLAVTPENRRRVVECGGLSTLVRVARSRFELVQEAVARAFVNLSYEEDIAIELVRTGAVPPIVALLRSPSPDVQQEATWVIVNLSVCPENEAALVEHKVLEPLVALLANAEPSVKVQAVWALGNLSRGASSKVQILTLGALGALRAFDNRYASADLQAATKKALHSLCQVLTPSSRRVIVTAGAQEGSPGGDGGGGGGGGGGSRGKGVEKMRSPLSRVASPAVVVADTT